MACTGLGRSNFFNKIATGEIRSVKIGKRRLIPDTAIDEYIARRAHETKVDAVLERVVAEESGVLERLKDA